MKKLNDIWEKYQKIELIGFNSFYNVYKAKNKLNDEYVAIKEIKKSQNDNTSKIIMTEIENMKKLKNSLLINDVIETPNSYNIIYELCYLSLEEYLKLRKNPLSIDEIRELLLNLNQTFKEMNDKKINHNNLKLSNIFILFDKTKINSTTFKISDFGFNKLYEGKIGKMNLKLETISPEILKGNSKSISSKSDIWSLGIIIYYLINKEYPYSGNDILKQIESDKKIKTINDKNLDDLIKKMLITNPNIRISWDSYFQHSFFNNKSNESNQTNQHIQNNQLTLPFYNLKCNTHTKNYHAYCTNCKCNVCDLCMKQHSSHKVVPFYKIGLTDYELNQFNNIISLIETNMNIISKIRSEITQFIKDVKSIKENNNVFGNDNQNNYKYYSIQCLNFINEKIKVNGTINLPVVQNNSFKWELKYFNINEYIIEYKKYLMFFCV